MFIIENKGGGGGAAEVYGHGIGGVEGGGTPTVGKKGIPARRPSWWSVPIAFAARRRLWPRSRRAPVRKRITAQRRRPLFSSHLKVCGEWEGAGSGGTLGRDPLCEGNPFLQVPPLFLSLSAYVR